MGVDGYINILLLLGVDSRNMDNIKGTRSDMIDDREHQRGDQRCDTDLGIPRHLSEASAIPLRMTKSPMPAFTATGDDDEVTESGVGY